VGGEAKVVRPSLRIKGTASSTVHAKPVSATPAHPPAKAQAADTLRTGRRASPDPPARTRSVASGRPRKQKRATPWRARSSPSRKSATAAGRRA
jgi:hypothetical protein